MKRRHGWLWAMTGIAVLLLLAWRWQTPTPPLQPAAGMVERSERPHSLRTLHIGTTSLLVEIAGTPDAWARGLMDRDTLPPNQGMLFMFPSASPHTFWMKNTRVPLDLIWIRGGAVVGVTPNVRPEPGVPDERLQRYGSPVPVDWVLEVNAGWANRAHVRVGERVVVLP